MGPEACDPVIDEVRAVRHRISASFGHDPARLVAHDIEMQKQYQGRLVGTPETDGTSAATPRPNSLDLPPHSDDEYHGGE